MWRLQNVDKKEKYLSIWYNLKSVYVDASAIIIDAHKSKKFTLTKPIKEYQAELEEEINEQRLSEGKKYKQTPTADFSSRPRALFCWVRRLAINTAFLVAGNVHDSQSFHQLYEKLDLKNTKIVGYKTPSILKKIFLSRKLPAVPYTF